MGWEMVSPGQKVYGHGLGRSESLLLLSHLMDPVRPVYRMVFGRVTHDTNEGRCNCH